MAKKGRQAGQTGAEQKQAERDALKGDMQKAAQDKARMMQVIEGMNRINGARNAMDAGGTASTLYDKFGDNAYELLATSRITLHRASAILPSKPRVRRFWRCAMPTRRRRTPWYRPC